MHCTGRALSPGPARASIKFLGPGLGVHFAGLNRGWAEKNIKHIGLGPGMDLV